MPVRRRDGARRLRLETSGHVRRGQAHTSAHRHTSRRRKPASTPADAFEDVAFALLLISAATIVDGLIALLVVIR